TMNFAVSKKCARAALSLLVALVTLPVATPSASALDDGRKPLKIGLALGGGGTRGAAHVGVLKVLTREKIPIDYIAGTSMGAVVGGLYSAGVSPAGLEEKFNKGTLMRSFLTVPLAVRVAIIPIMVLPRLIGHKPYDGMYVGGKFASYLNKSVPES